MKTFLVIVFIQERVLSISNSFSRFFEKQSKKEKGKNKIKKLYIIGLILA
jgi:hypothetical protein